MSKVALIIIYNHQYNQNIPIVEKIYKNRFSDIYHLVPFYEGNQVNVIPVYENSGYFQGYIAQAKNCIKNQYEHYFFIADDLILNPLFNEKNYQEELSINSNSCFFTEFIDLSKRKIHWPRVEEAFNWSLNVCGVEANKQLPSYENAIAKFTSHQISVEPLTARQLSKIGSHQLLFDLIFKKSWTAKIGFIKIFISRLWGKTYNLRYPMVGGYSDIFIVNHESLKKFCHYCGVFSATRLHVEVAIPTSITLSAKKIIFEKATKYQGRALWADGWGSLTSPEHYSRNDFDILSKYDFDIEKLLKEFPRDYLYLHPIKLSKWIKK
jgi:hypothetical protein